MTVYDLYQQYLNQLKSPVVSQQSMGIMDPYLLYPQQQGDGGGQDNQTNVINTTNNAGITSISDAYSKMSNYFSPYGMVGGVLGGIPGAFAGRAIGNLISNIQNPNTTMFGQPTEAYQKELENIAKQKRDIQQFTGGDSGGNGGGGGFSGHGGYGSSAERGGPGGIHG